MSAATIAANWLLFIAAVQNGQALEASLGYYIFPLLAVALGFVVLGERFSLPQAVAIAMAAAAVVVLTVGHGAAPWTAILIASTFAAYGLVKNRVPLGPMMSVFVETLILAPLALLWLWGLHTGALDRPRRAAGRLLRPEPRVSAMLAFSGVITGGPLILFAYAARRIPYATLGLVQYLNPTLQFLVAVLAFGEPFTRWHARRLSADLGRARDLFVGELASGERAQPVEQRRNARLRLEKAEEAPGRRSPARRCGARSASSGSQ